ncbi:MAG: hypothetical protein AB7S38_07240, partial [Vulcanimicrobiota bacterium]
AKPARGEGKPAEARPAQVKTEAKPGQGRETAKAARGEGRPAEARPAQVKTEAKPGQARETAKPARLESKPAEARPAQVKAEAKPGQAREVGKTAARASQESGGLQSKTQKAGQSKPPRAELLRARGDESKPTAEHKPRAPFKAEQKLTRSQGAKPASARRGRARAAEAEPLGRRRAAGERESINARSEQKTTADKGIARGRLTTGKAARSPERRVKSEGTLPENRTAGQEKNRETKSHFKPTQKLVRSEGAKPSRRSRQTRGAEQVRGTKVDGDLQKLRGRRSEEAPLSRHAQPKPERAATAKTSASRPHEERPSTQKTSQPQKQAQTQSAKTPSKPSQKLVRGHGPRPDGKSAKTQAVEAGRSRPRAESARAETRPHDEQRVLATKAGRVQATKESRPAGRSESRPVESHKLVETRQAKAPFKPTSKLVRSEGAKPTRVRSTRADSVQGAELRRTPKAGVRTLREEAPARPERSSNRAEARRLDQTPTRISRSAGAAPKENRRMSRRATTLSARNVEHSEVNNRSSRTKLTSNLKPSVKLTRSQGSRPRPARAMAIKTEASKASVARERPLTTRRLEAEQTRSERPVALRREQPEHKPRQPSRASEPRTTSREERINPQATGRLKNLKATGGRKPITSRQSLRQDSQPAEASGSRRAHRPSKGKVTSEATAPRKNEQQQTRAVFRSNASPTGPRGPDGKMVREQAEAKARHTDPAKANTEEGKARLQMASGAGGARRGQLDQDTRSERDARIREKKESKSHDEIRLEKWAESVEAKQTRKNEKEDWTGIKRSKNYEKARAARENQQVAYYDKVMEESKFNKQEKGSGGSSRQNKAPARKCPTCGSNLDEHSDTCNECITRVRGTLA